MRTGADRGLSALRLAVVLALALACGARGEREGELATAKIIVGNTQLEVEVAATAAERGQGLMHRKSLPEERGMLFIFPREQPLTFWMRNTTIPLSIAFASGSGRIVRIADLEPLSETLVPSGAPARFALEVNRGWFERHGVQAGDAILSIPKADVD